MRRGSRGTATDTGRWAVLLCAGELLALLRAGALLAWPGDAAVKLCPPEPEPWLDALEWPWPKPRLVWTTPGPEWPREWVFARPR